MPPSAMVRLYALSTGNSSDASALSVERLVTAPLIEVHQGVPVVIDQNPGQVPGEHVVVANGDLLAPA